MFKYEQTNTQISKSRYTNTYMCTQKCQCKHTNTQMFMHSNGQKAIGRLRTQTGLFANVSIIF